MGIHRAWESEKLWPSRVVGTCVLTEADAIGILCAFLGGEPEVYQSYEAQDGQHWAYVDCLTERHAVEVGLDRRSSLDSVQQAAFYGWLTGRKPIVAIIDTDETEDRHEMQIRTSARVLGVEYRRYPIAFLIRWQMTEHFRARRKAVLNAY